MAIQGPFKVACGDVFPHGVGVVGAVTPLVDFDRSSKDTKVQQLDKESGVPVWTVTPYLKETGNGRARVAYSLRASGLAAPRGMRAVGDAGKAA